MAKQEKSDNLPVHTVRHRSLKAAIWRNPTEKGVMYNVTVTRSYKDKESGEWHDVCSFGYDDLMNVAALMHEAHSHISALKAKDATRKKPLPKPAERQ